MREYKFKSGDRVTTTRDIGHSDFVLPKGITGTVVEDRSTMPFVRWDTKIAGMHDCCGHCKGNDGTAEDERDLKQFEEGSK